MKKVFVIFLALLSVMVFSQKKDTVIIDQDDEIKIAALPYYNFGKGVGMTSPDSLSR